MQEIEAAVGKTREGRVRRSHQVSLVDETLSPSLSRCSPVTMLTEESFAVRNWRRRRTRNLVTLIVLCWVGQAQLPTCDGLTASAEVVALEALRDAFRLPAWTGDPCLTLTWINCTVTQPATVAHLELISDQLNGSIPSAIADLRNLEELTLSQNDLVGPIPELSNLTKLTWLNIGDNRFNGSVPAATLSAIPSLRWIDLGGNNYSGSVPDLIGLPQLLRLNLSSNQLTGPLPDFNSWSARNISSLVLNDNRLSGPLPDLGTLANISEIQLQNNNFSGTLPKSLFQLQKLRFLHLENNNQLEGPIPDIGPLASVELFYLANCSLNGSIPESLTNLKNAIYLNLQGNNLTGSIPSNLSNMKNLQYLWVRDNQLSGPLPNLPGDIFRLISAERNQLSGTIPINLTNFFWLDTISLGQNKLSGDIPNFTNQPFLKTVDLQDNSFTGSIPEFYNRSQPFDHESFLQTIFLNNNNLSGTIPDSLSQHTRLQTLSLHHNQLRGNIPMTFDQLINLEALMLNNNQLTGPIPDLSALHKLKILSLHHNFLAGTIPDLSALTTLEQLHLQDNNLSGPVPIWIANLPNLKELFLDNNLFTNIPDAIKALPGRGVNVTYANNPLVDGNGNTGSKSSIGGIVGGVVAGVFGIIILIAAFFFWRRRKQKKPEHYISKEDMPKSAEAFSLKEIKMITENFKTIIGKGGFGTVYYGKLVDGKEVAVKVKAENSTQGAEEFLNEVRLLSRLHHRNLVPLVGYCLEGHHQILLYVYMSNGTLHEHLHRKGSQKSTDATIVGSLDWKTRLDIALNAARGLEYLHKDCNPSVIHRDVKCSNILLTDKLQAKVGDLGISKLAPEEGLGVSGVSTAIKGTYGYLDPEYFTKRKLTTKSDVYSFGMVLLEIITAHKPQSQSFPGSTETNIIDWVHEAVQGGKIEEIIDPALNGNYQEAGTRMITELALSCLELRGTGRPGMGEIVQRLMEALQIEGVSPGEASSVGIRETGDDPRIPLSGKFPARGSFSLVSSGASYSSKSYDDSGSAPSSWNTDPR